MECCGGTAAIKGPYFKAYHVMAFFHCSNSLMIQDGDSLNTCFFASFYHKIFSFTAALIYKCCTNTVKIFVWNSNGVNLSIKPFTKYLSTVLYCLLASTVIWLYILSHNIIYKLLSCECIYRSRENRFDRLKTLPEFWFEILVYGLVWQFTTILLL